MLHPLIETLLQEVATEMAFLAPAQNQGLAELAVALTQLAQASSRHSMAQVQPDLGAAIGLCEVGLQTDQGLSEDQLGAMQAAFERCSDALYLAKPTDTAPQSEPEIESEPEANAQANPKANPEVKAKAEPAAENRLDDASEEAGFVIQADDDLELLNEFCNEGRDLLGQVEQGVLVLEDNPKHKDTLNQVFRAFHTFKGGAGFLGIAPIKELAHQLESLLDAVRRDQMAIDRHVIELILAGADALQQFVDAIALQLSGQGGAQRITVPTADLLLRVQACLKGERLEARAEAHVDAHAEAPVESTAVVSPASLAPSAAPQPQLPTATPALPATPVIAAAPVMPTALQAPATPLTAAPKAPPRAPAVVNYVKLDTHKLDVLVDLMGELVIAQSMVVQHPLVQGPKDRELESHLRQLARITTDLQHNAMSLRMVPIRSVFQKMTRLVRDLAAAQNKQVQLQLSGEDTELDRNIVEELADPLLHMIRNGVDHGVEMPADRLAGGKPAQGNIHLHAAHQGGGILIRMQDDGKGLDAQKILAKAIQRGLIPAESAPAESDIYKLIFLPGFSTAETVTDISGRGVGMDVVRGSIQKMRGRIDIESVPGQGTTFNIFLPLTLAIIDGMLVGVGQERFILPTLTIRESLRPQPGMVSSVQGKGEVISVRGKLIPLVRLADKLGIPGVANDPCEGIVVVVDSGARPRALLVDSLIGKQEVVIKSLGDTFKQNQGMSGAAIMGDGHVALIIDPEALSQLPSVPFVPSVPHVQVLQSIEAMSA